MEQDTPTEILLLIFNDQTKKDLRKISLVCRQWRKVIKDYQLIDDYVITLYLSSTSRRCQKFLRDVRHYPSFGKSIKTLKICESLNASSLESMQVDTMFKACPNLETFIIGYDTKTLSWDITTKVSICNEIHSKLRVTSVKYIISRMYALPFLIDLSKLVHYTTSKLKELDICTPFEDVDNTNIRVIFVKSDILHANVCFLTTIKLVCPNFMITKDCVHYIISGEFTALENLDLFAQYIYSTNKNHQAIRFQVNTMRWNRIRNFCLSSLKNYNIYLTSGNHFFHIDNCKNENDRYYLGG